jgi:hypothetical protein
MSPNSRYITDSKSDECKPTCESEQGQAEKCQFEYSFPNNHATWMNENGQVQSVDRLCLDVNIDALTTNKAIFKLSCSIFLKMKNNNKQTIYLFIYPPSIHSIKLEIEEGRASLHFYMNRNPALVVPGNGPLEPKAGSEQLLNLMKALSLVKDLPFSWEILKYLSRLSYTWGMLHLYSRLIIKTAQIQTKKLLISNHYTVVKEARLLMQLRLLQVSRVKRVHHRHTAHSEAHPEAHSAHLARTIGWSAKAKSAFSCYSNYHHHGYYLILSIVTNTNNTETSSHE